MNKLISSTSNISFQKLKQLIGSENIKIWQTSNPSILSHTSIGVDCEKFTFEKKIEDLLFWRKTFTNDSSNRPNIEMPAIISISVD